MNTFGKTILDARKDLGISQKDLASRIKKEDGNSISAQYLNDIEHDRRNPPSEEMIEQFSEELNLDKDVLCLIAGTLPKDVQKLGKENPEKVKEFFKAFRRDLK
jgi:transcriptional regulator with XRE-family HTH domain